MSDTRVAAALPAVKIAGIPALSLSFQPIYRKVSEADALRYKVPAVTIVDAVTLQSVTAPLVIVSRWSTMTSRPAVEVARPMLDANGAPMFDENGELIAGDAFLKDQPDRWSVLVPAPMVGGKVAPLPITCEVSSFGEKGRALALATFTTPAKGKGTDRVHTYGAVEVKRPTGRTYVQHVKVKVALIGEQDAPRLKVPMGTVGWRIASLLAQ